MKLRLTTFLVSSAHTADLQRRKNTNAYVNCDLSEAGQSGANLSEAKLNWASRATPSVEAIG
mgnify:CR=1